jgi:23S rRNA (guanosine2251-2'-O)-methyltransferase
VQKKTMDELGRKAPEEIKESEKHPIIVILDEVRSMHNVGSAFRTCDAFAIEALYLCGYTPTPPHRDIHKTALGATESVKWMHFTSTADAVNAAKKDGYAIYAVEQAHNSMMLQEMSPGQKKTALIFGNEVTGVNDEVLKMADGCIEIPQWGAKHSLNIAVSMGVVLWEMVRQTPKP